MENMLTFYLNPPFDFPFLSFLEKFIQKNKNGQFFSSLQLLIEAALPLHEAEGGALLPLPGGDSPPPLVRLRVGQAVPSYNRSFQPEIVFFIQSTLTFSGILNRQVVSHVLHNDVQLPLVLCNAGHLLCIEVWPYTCTHHNLKNLVYAMFSTHNDWCLVKAMFGIRKV